MRGRNGRALWLGLLMLVAGILIPGIYAHAEGGNDTTEVVSINEEGEIEIRAKHYFIDQADGVRYPVTNEQFAIGVGYTFPGVPLPFPIEMINKKTGTTSFYCDEEGTTKAPILLANEMVKLQEVAKSLQQQGITQTQWSFLVKQEFGRGYYTFNKNYIQYDETQYIVKINLTEDFDNIESFKLYRVDYQNNQEIPLDDGTELAFHNKVKPASLPVHAKLFLKNQSGEERTPEVDAFTFQILDEQSNVVASGKNKADGSIAFTPIRLIDEKQHTYTIQQVQDPEKHNITYDNRAYTLKAKANEPSGNDFKPLELKEKEIKYFSGTDKVNEIVFTNIAKEGKVHFDPNGGSGTMQDVNVALGSDYTLPACGFTAPSGKTFKAWKVGNDEKQANDTITVNGDITVQALWKKKSGSSITPGREMCTITFDFDEGVWTNPATGEQKDSLVWYVNKGDTIHLPSAPVREGYTFSYWKGSKYHPGDAYTVVGDHTFTAMWEKNQEKTESETPHETPKREDPQDILKRLKGVYERGFVTNGGKPTALPKAGVGGK